MSNIATWSGQDEITERHRAIGHLAFFMDIVQNRFMRDPENNMKPEDRRCLIDYIVEAYDYYSDLHLYSRPYTEQERSREKLKKIKQFLGLPLFYSIFRYMNMPKTFSRLGPRKKRENNIKRHKARRRRKFVKDQTVALMNEVKLLNPLHDLYDYNDGAYGRYTRRYGGRTFTFPITIKDLNKKEKFEVQKSPLSFERNYAFLVRAYVDIVLNGSKISFANTQLNFTDTLSEIGIGSEAILEYSGILPLKSLEMDDATFTIFIRNSTDPTNVVSVDIADPETNIESILVRLFDTGYIKTCNNDKRVWRILTDATFDPQHFKSMRCH